MALENIIKEEIIKVSKNIKDKLPLIPDKLINSIDTSVKGYKEFHKIMDFLETEINISKRKFDKYSAMADIMYIDPISQLEREVWSFYLDIVNDSVVLIKRSIKIDDIKRLKTNTSFYKELGVHDDLLNKNEVLLVDFYYLFVFFFGEPMFFGSPRMLIKEDFNHISVRTETVITDYNNAIEKFLNSDNNYYFYSTGGIYEDTIIYRDGLYNKPKKNITIDIDVFIDLQNYESKKFFTKTDDIHISSYLSPFNGSEYYLISYADIETFVNKRLQKKIKLDNINYNIYYGQDIPGFLSTRILSIILIYYIANEISEYTLKYPELMC